MEYNALSINADISQVSGYYCTTHTSAYLYDKDLFLDQELIFQSSNQCLWSAATTSSSVNTSYFGENAALFNI